MFVDSTESLSFSHLQNSGAIDTGSPKTPTFAKRIAGLGPEPGAMVGHSPAGTTYFTASETGSPAEASEYPHYPLPLLKPTLDIQQDARIAVSEQHLDNRALEVGMASMEHAESEMWHVPKSYMHAVFCRDCPGSCTTVNPPIVSCMLAEECPRADNFCRRVQNVNHLDSLDAMLSAGLDLLHW